MPALRSYCILVQALSLLSSHLRQGQAYEYSGVVKSTDTLSDCIFVVNIEDATPSEKLAASIAVGLVNRKFDKPTAAALNGPNDWKWVNNIRQGQELRQQRWVKASLADFLTYGVATGAIEKVIEYQPTEGWALANVVTMAGIEKAIPIPADLKGERRGSGQPENVITSEGGSNVLISPAYSPHLVYIDEAPPRGPRMGWGSIDTHLGLDALGGNFSQGVDAFHGLQSLPRLDVSKQWDDDLDATLWAWFNLYPKCNRTDEVIVIQRPEVLSGGFLTDFTAMRQLFVFFLPAMCTPGAQQLLFDAMTDAAYSKGKQLTVMGYSIEDEVVADCSSRHTEISLVSDWCPNLSFYSKMQPLSANLSQIPQGDDIVYNPSDIYLAVINSDGDNLQIENNGNRDGMEARVQLCAQPGNVCPPLGWTISNHLTTIAPFQLQWYYEQAQKTGRDTFMMGPTGYGFLHPAAIAINETLLTNFVKETVAAAEQLSMTSYVHWDVDSNGFSHRSMAHLGMTFPGQAAKQGEEQRSNKSTAALRWWRLVRQTLTHALDAIYSQVRPQTLSDNVEAPLAAEASGLSFPATQEFEVLASSRRLHMQQESHASPPRLTKEKFGGQGLLPQGTDTAGAMRRVPQRARMGVGGTQDSVAREAYLQRFNGTIVDTVFSPGEYHIPDWVGDVAGIQELFRWGKEEQNLTNIVERFNSMPPGTIGYIYKIFEVDMAHYEEVAQKIASNVHLVDHRQMHNLALQKKNMGL